MQCAGGLNVLEGWKKRRQRDYENDVAEGSLLVAVVCWALQLHLFDILATVLFSMQDYRLAWLHPGGSGLSCFESNVAIAVALLVLGILYTARALRESSSTRALVVPVTCVLFVSSFSYRLVFLDDHALDDKWYAEATQDEPWDDHRYYLGLVLEAPGATMATILLENQKEVLLALPSTGDPTRVIEVVEQRSRYSGLLRYKAAHFIPYDDLELFLSRFTSLEHPR